MTEYSVVTARQKAAFRRFDEILEPSRLPEFLNHDEVVERHWDRLVESFPDFQFVVVEDGTGEPVGRGHSIPLRFEEGWSALPVGGLDWALEKGFQDHEAGLEPKLLSALFIVISRHHLGQGLSYRMLAAMRGIGYTMGLTHLIAPVRPSSKSRFPLIPMAEYCRWRRTDDSPFDPWIRVHVRSGGLMLHPCPEAMVVRASLSLWAGWTGLEFPGDGSYVVPGGLVPLSVDLAAGEGSYVEPGVWILHETGPKKGP